MFWDGEVGVPPSRAPRRRRVCHPRRRACQRSDLVREEDKSTGKHDWAARILYATLFSTNANDFLLTAPVGDTGEGASVDAAARAFCGGGGDICGEMETSPRPGITAQDFLLAPPTPLTEFKGFSF